MPFHSECHEGVARVMDRADRLAVIAAEQLLKRYLDNHCLAADQEGLSVVCDCPLCHDTRTYLGLPTWTHPESASTR